MKHNVPKLNNQDLHTRLTDHHCQENPVCVDTAQHVAFPMDLTGIQFIEYLHEDESVEHDSEVFSWISTKISPGTILDIKQNVPCKDEDKQDC